MNEPITSRVIIELLGKPKEHIEKTIHDYVEKIKKDEAFTVLKEDFSEIKKQEETEFWACFTELEVKSTIKDLIRFCFEYMPSVIEILQPERITFSDNQASEFLNDLQARLHHVDMIAKQMKVQTDLYKKNMTSLFRNYIVILLSKGDLSSGQISTFTGVPKDLVEDYLDVMLDEKQIKMEGDKYILVKNGAEEEN